MKITQTSWSPEYVRHDVPLPVQEDDRITITTRGGKQFRIIENDDGSIDVSADFGVRITPASSNHLTIEYVNP